MFGVDRFWGSGPVSRTLFSSAFKKFYSAGAQGKTLFADFARSESGNVAIIFGLTIAIIFGAVGGAIDYGRWLTARTQTQNAVDAAVLAAGRVLQSSGGDTSAALEAARTYYRRLKPDTTIDERVDFTLTDNGAAIEAITHSFVETPFLSAVGIKSMPVNTTAKAVLAAGGNSETNLEVSMMLDITGSMSGNKLKDLKLAAKDLINIVVWENQNEYTSRVAIVPFAPRVNVGSYITQLTGLPSSKRFSKKDLKPIQCVTERTGAAAFTDDAPASGKYLGAYNGKTGNSATKDQSNYSSNGNCSDPSSSEAILPLTNNKTLLLSKIDSLTAGGSTAGQLGTAFAWYLISPKWAHIWPAQSRPAPYSELDELNEHGEPRLRKIAILMTDGVYNTQGGTQYSDNSTNAKTISNNSVQICNNMKAAGITVYTVGFDLGGNQLAIKTLKDCATSDEHFYNTQTGDQLRQAFRDIALKISRLRLAM